MKYNIIQHMNKRYRVTIALVLAALLAGGNAMAQQQEQVKVRVHGNVYGGGNVAEVQTNTTVTIKSGDVTGSVFGGGNQASVSQNVTVNMLGGEIGVDVYGGGALAEVNTKSTTSNNTTTYPTTTVNLLGGVITGNAYGGGLGDADHAADAGNTKVNLNGLDDATDMDATLRDAITGTNDTSKPLSDDYLVKSTVKGCVVSQVFGGNNVNGSPKGNVTVHVFATQHADKATIVDPRYNPPYSIQDEGETDKVYLQRLITGAANTDITSTETYTNANEILTGMDDDAEFNSEQEATVQALVAAFSGLYDVQAVYGGGNQAAYNPTNPNTSTTTVPNGPRSQVIIEGCDYTSIQYVYGGGNAAPVPETNVEIRGTKIIDVLFGGGNGTVVPANVGFDDNGDDYGTGIATTRLIAGNIYTVFGGSNSQGNVRVRTDVSMPSKPTGVTPGSGKAYCTDINIKNLYGAGRNAEQDGGVKLVLGCIKGEDNVVYGGAKDAHIKGGVDLTITSGKFKKIFGGNDLSGTIQGPIVLNIEETGCDPIEIEELYLGGNQAAYSIYGYENTGTNAAPVWEPRTQADYNTWLATLPEADRTKPENQPYANPQLNVISCTSIGSVFGGGYGEGAKMYGNPVVNINMIKGTPNGETSSSLGTIGDVYGGGNEAAVYGDPYVNIGTEAKVTLKSVNNTQRSVEGANITGNVYGGGNQADVTGNTQVNICAKYDEDDEEWQSVTPDAAGVTIGENVFGGGKGIASDVTKALITANTNIHIGNGAIKKSVYGGGELAQVEGNTNVTVMGGTIGTAKADLPSGVTMGAVYGNIYGGGMGNTTNSAAGQIKGNTNVNINNGTILHNIYGGGAYGSVGTFTYDATSEMPTALATENTGVCNVTITGGTIGTDGQENGMVFGSSRGDVAKPVGTPAVDPNDKLAWVYNANVVIGTQGSETGPDIKGSIYGSGENGHTFNNTAVTIHSGTIGIVSGSTITTNDNGTPNDTSDDTTYSGAEYPYRGNVYGGGCGTDKYDSDNDGVNDAYNPLAGIVYGDATVTMTGGQIVHNVYGAGAMGSVGKTTTDANNHLYISSGGTTTIAISGGTVGVDGTDGDGNVFGAARGDVDAPLGLAQVKTTNVTISGTTAGTTIWGNVYGGGALGDVGTYTTSSDDTNTYDTGSGACSVTVTGGTIHQDVFGAGMGDVSTYQCKKAMANSASVTIANGTVGGSVYGGGQIARVENNTEVKIGVGADGTTTYYKNTDNSYTAVKPAAGANLAGLYLRSGEAESYTYTIISASEPEITGSVFGAGAGVETHGYSALVRGNSSVTIEGDAKVRQNVYGGGKIATVGRYLVATPANIATVQQDYPDIEVGMPYEKRSGGTCTVIVRGDAQVGPDNGATLTAGHVFGAGKGVGPDIFNNYAYTAGSIATMPWRMTTAPTAPTTMPSYYEDLGGGYIKEYYPTLTTYFRYLETLALATTTDVTIGGNATVKGSVYGGSESGFVQDDTDVKIQDGTIGTSGSTTYGDVYGGGRGLDTFAEAGKVKGDTEVAISGGTTNGNVYGGGELGYVKQNVTVNVSGGTVVNDVYGGGALADTNTDNWDASANNGAGGWATVNNVSMNDANNGTTYKTTVNITGGTIGNAYGGGLGQLGTGVPFTESDCITYNAALDGAKTTGNQLSDAEAAAYNATLPGAISTGTALSAYQVTLVNNELNTSYTAGDAISLADATAYNATLTDAITASTALNAEQATAYNAILSGAISTSDWATHPADGTGNVKAMVYGDVTVTVNEQNATTYGTAKFTTASESKQYAKTYIDANNVKRTEDVTGTVYKKGRVFGANNINGTPKGNVTVTVWSTTPLTGTSHVFNNYEIQGVYGGGNLANYEPVDGKETHVNIHGCGRTSIQYVFGGGNAASVPETHVEIFGTFEIEAVFGGGNGNEPVSYDNGTTYVQSPGAEIMHNTNVTLRAGLMHQAFGGSFEKGTIHGSTNLDKSGTGGDGCELKITDIFGGGKDADVQSVNIILSECEMGNILGENQNVNPQQIENVYAGSYNARIFGDVTMTVRSGYFKNVFGGNYQGGFINGSITINIEETENCKPIKIDNLYGGGNFAPYPGLGANNSNPKITVNVKACTSIGNIYGGSFHADVNGDTEVNVNMMKGWWAGKHFPLDSENDDDLIPDAIGTIGNIFGGGNEGKIIGDTKVNIGNLTEISLETTPDNDPTNNNQPPRRMTVKQNGMYDVLGANITGDVYGGGKLADVTGNTQVNICAKEVTSNNATTWQSVPLGASGVTIGGNIFGGGQGRADNFECDKAMVGTNDHGEDNNEGNTFVRIGNGTVGGNVYGGGEVGRVESHTNVTIGFGGGVATGSTPTSAPVIRGNVFGAGQGVATHGYSGLVRGHSTVTIQGNAKVGQSVYGGGQKATVGRFWVKNVNDENYEHKDDYPNVPTGMPYARMSGGKCTVTIQGYAEIGPDNMTMPTFSGHVFGAGKGLTPYLDTDTEAGSGDGQGPGRWYAPNGVYTWQSYANNETKYLEYIQTLALADETDVTIAGHAFVKGSVYGGSENGRVLDDTSVKIQGDCQIGNGWDKTANNNAGAGVNHLYTDAEWEYDVTSDDTKFLYECNSWPYTSPYAPYDKFNYGGGSTTATDGHTFYGNVFGGGSGYFPYDSGKWHSEAGAVGGNTVVNITGGHILTNVYGGNELTNVEGTCYVNFGGTATLGVPRTLGQIGDHPVTCYLFGAGKGDQRVLFNKQTNVQDVIVNVTGGKIYGSVFGGGEDGHVLGDVTMTIKDSVDYSPKIGTWGTSYVEGNVFGGGRGFGGDAYTAGNVGGNINMTISGGEMLGSIYGGGRLGSVGYDLEDPTITTNNETTANPNYGVMSTDTDRGHIEITISGGTIGNNREFVAVPDNINSDNALATWKTTNHIPNTEYKDSTYTKDNVVKTVKRLTHTKGGNVFAGGMGRRTKLDGSDITEIDWMKLGNVKSTKLTISGNAIIKSNVYGGGEFGEVTGYHTTTDDKQLGTEISITGGTIGTRIPASGDNEAYYFGSVFGGGMGNIENHTVTEGNVQVVTMDPKIGGNVKYNTDITMSLGTINGNIYGGGELGSVGTITNDLEEKDSNNKYKYRHDFTPKTNDGALYSFGLSWPYEFVYDNTTGMASVSITGNAIVNEYVFGGGKGQVDVGINDITKQRFAEALVANVRATQVVIGTASGQSQPRINHTVYGGAEDGHVYQNASVDIYNGTIAHSVFGGGKGTSQYTTKLWNISSPGNEKSYPDGSKGESVYSWTAGKVYGNTTVTMYNGTVGYDIYGGGNIASVGKGNYAGGTDDYSIVGYGELPPLNGTTESQLWSNTDFTGSGTATVNIYGGTLGKVGNNPSGFDSDNIPYGSVFGGSRGKAAETCILSPRYRYVPDSFLGYVNKTIINIGDQNNNDNSYTGPAIYGSIYGGGQDGHVRNSTEVKIFKGSISGQPNDTYGRSGHVFGAGSGIGRYSDANNNLLTNNASGSVTCTTLVEVNGGNITGNVYGGGAMASIGPPNTGPTNGLGFDEFKDLTNYTRPNNYTTYNVHASKSYTKVNIKDGVIGGSVFGASRGPSDMYLAEVFSDNNPYDATKYATDIWSEVNVSGGTIGTVQNPGSVYGGGETGQVKCDVNVNITGGIITGDVYGGGALAHTNTSNWDATNNTWANGKYTEATTTTPAHTTYKTVVNLLGGEIKGDAYGGALGRVEEKNGNTVTKSAIAAKVYGDVKVNLNGLDAANDMDATLLTAITGENDTSKPLFVDPDDHFYKVKTTKKGAIVNQIFGANNLNGTPMGHVKVHVFATQNKDFTTGENPLSTKYPKRPVQGENEAVADYLGRLSTTYTDVTSVIELISAAQTANTNYNNASESEKETKLTALNTALSTMNDKLDELYDVQAVYGGGNLSAYEPAGGKNTTDSTEVIIDGCNYTSIRQVYGGGNAASAPATYVRVNGTYEIFEVFGGGNGNNPYTLNDITYLNPGANVGYYNYTHWVADGEKKFKPVDNTASDPGGDASTPEKRRQNYSYGSGIARTEIKGGTIHAVYGGSNEKGNIQSTAVSAYEEEAAICPMHVDETYGAGKNAPIDGEVKVNMSCASGIKEIFGGAKNAPVNSNIVLKITNGSSLERVFGGNNTSGKINGSITVIVEEGGCEPIIISDGLYAGGYLAPYSVYGYKEDGTPYTKAEYDAKTAAEKTTLGLPATPYHDPVINVISATSIANIYGGGYKATVAGNPHVNVNMTKGKVEVQNIGTTDPPVYQDVNQVTYTTDQNATGTNIKHTEQIVNEGTAEKPRYYATLPIGTIGNIYGGGDEADIWGDTYVEIGTGEWLNNNREREMLGTTQDITTPTSFTYDEANKVWKYVSGGTDENPTYTSLTSGITPTPFRNAATITGNVFGGGKGKADNYACDKAMVGIVDSDNGSTSVTIGNGTVNGDVFGGGMIGRVEKNTEVTIGLTTGIGEPIIKGNVFGAGQGIATHGYSGLTRGNSTVIVQGKAKVRGSVYGGGQKATVGRFWVKDINDSSYDDKDKYDYVPTGMPYALMSGGYCSVTIQDDAEIGPEDAMEMTATDGPDDHGHVFGAGKGITPYVDTDTKDGEGVGQGPGRWYNDNTNNNQYTWEPYANDEAKYLNYIETLALANETNVVIKGNAFVKGSVYGGSENGIVLDNTHVTIDGDCQIGNGYVQMDNDGNYLTTKRGVNRRYSAAEWEAGHLIVTDDPATTDVNETDPDAELVAAVGSNYSTSLPECASWRYEAPYATYDKFANASGELEQYSDGSSTKGGRLIASDGHTFYGNVFGGGSGFYPYKPGKWHRAAGSVRGNTVVDILGGHILTSVYGGNEQTDVGTYDTDELTLLSGGKCTINMVGGTLGVPRTLGQIAHHPVTCYLFGAGKGDPRIFFNTWTNVKETEVNISGDALIYGSTFGGGEDGHVMNDAVTNIGGTVEIDLNGDGDKTDEGESIPAGNNLKIGTWGTSYVDGNVFGGGRGFSGDAQTAGSVGGNVTLTISGGKMLGSVYGGGRLASVGTQFTDPEDDNYGNFVEDDITEATYYTSAEAEAYNTENNLSEGEEGYKKKGDEKTPAIVNSSFGHVIVNINGGTIGGGKAGSAEELAAGLYDMRHSGNVFGGSMGRLELLKGGINPIWPKMAQVKTTTVNIYGNAEIKRNVYGGGELGTVRDNVYVTIGGIKMADVDADGHVAINLDEGTSCIVGRDVYGGGYGSEDDDTHTVFTVNEPKEDAEMPYTSSDYEEHTYAFTPMQFAGCVGQNAYVHIVGGRVKKSVYGGGEMASVGIINCRVDSMDTKPGEDQIEVGYNDKTEHYYYYKNMVKHAPVKVDGKDVYYGFGLSWPYEFSYVPTFDGKTHVHISGGRIGLKTGEPDFADDKDNGDVYGGGKGFAGDFNDYVFCANVGSTEVHIEYPTTLNPETNDYNADGDCIAGAVYAGAENGHVMGDAKLSLEGGLVGHSIYGGGSGKGQFTKWLTMIPEERRDANPNTGSGTAPEQSDNMYKATCYSITAGKVFGNTELEMTGGYVVRNVYGGGNMGSVGKGNYSGGSDDYSAAGYGELPPSDNLSLWENTHFLNSGKCTVKITGGTVGYIGSNPSKSMYPLTSDKQPYDASLPYGNVFGGCRGESAPNIQETPRYLYSPEFFVGYVNETEVIIGTSGQSSEDAGASGKAPRILGSVYGGGQDGHVRRDTHVTVNSGEIGLAYNTANRQKVGTLTKDNPTTEQINSTSDLDDKQWVARGNVYGAGSGIGKYKYDFNYDGDYEDKISYQTPGENPRTSTLWEEDNSTSAGSVTRFTTVNINGGKIHRNVYGGGSMASVGAPKIPVNGVMPADPLRRDDTEEGKATQGKQSLNLVNISSTIGTPDDYQAHYGGEVYGASRGLDATNTSLATSIWTEVNLLPGAHVQGNVFGGGDNGMVKQDAEVNVGTPLGVSLKSIDFKKAGGTTAITVTTKEAWTTTKSEAGWLAISPASGTGNGTVTVTADENNTGAERTATITITGGGQTKTIAVTQAGGS